MNLLFAVCKSFFLRNGNLFWDWGLFGRGVACLRRLSRYEFFLADYRVWPNMLLANPYRAMEGGLATCRIEKRFCNPKKIYGWIFLGQETYAGL